MKLGVAIEDTWSFFNEVYAEFAAHHDVSLFTRRNPPLPIFKERLARRRFQSDLRTFMQENDVVFFEWASELLAHATQVPSTCGIVTRLHRFELYQWAERVNWNAVDRIILVSESKRLEFSERFPAQSHKLVVIPEAVSLERFRPHARRFQGNIATLCHLRPRKRVYDLILAFHELSQRRSDLHLHIGGGRSNGFEEYEIALHRLVNRLDLSSRVTFYDHIARPEEWYGAMDIFISNSYSEGLQVSALEAMASGCFCLSHFWEGADELLPPENLFFTERELIDRVLTYCSLPEPEKRTRCAAMRQIVAGRHDLSTTKVQIRQVVESVQDEAR